MEEIKSSPVERTTVLRKLATICDAVKTHHLSPERVRGVLRFAVEQKVITVDSLAKLIGVEGTVVQSWMEERSDPSSEQQIIILTEIQKMCLAESEHLAGGGRGN